MSRRTRKNVGVIGLGIIGSRVAQNLRKKRFHVFVWNRTPRPVPNFVGSPAEIAEMCDYVQIFVADDEALLHVAEELTPALAPRHIVFAHPTVSPQSMHRASEIIERRGARFIEAPFTGSKMAAESGELVYYVAGDEAALKEGRPILEASSKEIITIGEIGQATAVKVATNIVTAASVQGAAEALALIRTVGLPLEKFVEAMRGNASNSKCLEMKLPKMIERNFDPHFSVKHMLKDIQIAIRLGLSHHLELAITAATRDRLLEQMQQGHEEEDYSVVARRYLPEIRTPAAEEAASPQLFLEQLPLVSFPEFQSTQQEPSNFVPLMPEMAVQDTDTSNLGTIPIPESVDASAAAPEPKPEPESSIAAPEEVIPEASEEVIPPAPNEVIPPAPEELIPAASEEVIPPTPPQAQTEQETQPDDTFFKWWRRQIAKQSGEPHEE
jgi:3-hydroxyisobutyrate dehydrogenase-like beta-hydroxyacid dehydrogenase